MLIPVHATLAQQPFVTDDADATEQGTLHFEFSNEFDVLPVSAFPNLRQNTASFELAFGLFENVEVSVEAPLITVFNARGTTPRGVFGLGAQVGVSVDFRGARQRERNKED